MSSDKMTRKFSIVMPIIQASYLWNEETQQRLESTQNHNNFKRFFKIGGPFLKRFLRWKDVATFWVVLPRDEMQEFQTEWNKSCLHDQPFTLIAQEDLLPKNVATKNLKKSRIQMLCKILIAEKVTTEHYLLLDDDIILKKPFGYKDLFADRIRNKLRMTSADVYHEEWWNGSMDVLGMTDDEKASIEKELRLEMEQGVLMNVTPQIIVTRLMRDLIDRVPVATLIKASSYWTEYTLYWLFMKRYHNPSLYYTSRKNGVHLSNDRQNVWYDAPDLQNKIQTMFANSKTYFGVIQSNAPLHTVDYVLSALESC